MAAVSCECGVRNTAKIRIRSSLTAKLAVNQIIPTVDTPTVHPTYVRMLCTTLRRRGVDVDAALQAAGIAPWSEMATSETLLSHRAVDRLIAVALQTSACPWLGLEVGATVQISAHGPLGFAAIASRDLLQALQTVVRFGGLRYGAIRYRMAQEPGGAVLTLIERVDLGESRTFIVCMMMAALVRIGDAVVGHPLHGMVVDLPFARPPWHDEVARLCAGQVRYDAGQLAFHLDAAALTQPGLTADANAYAQACLRCEQLQAQAESVPLAQRVDALLDNCEGSYPTLTELAETFHMAPRTLIRRLKQEGSSYQALLDHARQQRALWYLHHTHHTVEEIATRLGYTDTTNFSRTFRRWFGQAPGAVRQAGLSLQNTNSPR